MTRLLDYWMFIPRIALSETTRKIKASRYSLGRGGVGMPLS